MRPHPFSWVVLGALVLALVAATLAPDRAPAIALYWNPIYRAEIALVVLALAYLIVIAGWMAWHGEAFRRIELPGGAALERDSAELDAAATNLQELQTSLIARVDAVEDALASLNDRIDGLEGEPDAGGSGVP